MTLQGLGHTLLFILRIVSVLCVLRCVMLFVTITPLLRSMEGTCHGQVCIVVLVAHLVLSVLAALGICVGYMWCFMWCLEHLCVGYMYCGVLGVHLVQEGSGPSKIPNFFHLLWSYGTYMHFVRHERIDPRQS